MQVPFGARTRASMAAALALLVCAGGAEAKITAPTEGSVQRGDVLIQEDTGAVYDQTGLSSLGKLVCGIQALGSKTVVTVKDAGGATVYTTTKSGLGAFAVVWDTTGVPNGQYTATTAATDIRKKPTSASSCDLTTKTSSVTFELRKWQHTFTDAAGKGKVEFNLTPVKELQITLGDRSSGIVSGDGPGAGLVVVRAPKTSKALLPTDLAACIADVASCLPKTPAQCQDAPETCEPRMVIADIAAGRSHGLAGTFDTRTKAFAAVAGVGDRIEAIGNVGDSCGEAARELKLQGLDVDAVLGGQEVEIPIPVAQGGTTRTFKANAADLCAFAQAMAVEVAGLSTAKGAGVLGLPEVSAGLQVHFFLDLTTGFPKAPEPASYSITQSQLVPELPALELPALPELPAVPLPTDGLPTGVPTTPTALAAALLPQGKLTQVKGGGWKTAGLHVSGLLNVDTAPNAQTGVWLPVLTTGVTNDSSIDFLGYGTATQTKNCDAVVLCISTGLVLGNGAAVYGPSPVQLPVIP